MMRGRPCEHRPMNETHRQRLHQCPARSEGDRKVVVKSSRRAAVFALAAYLLPVALGVGGTAYASAGAALTNESGNPYFPLIVGETWKYRQVAGPGAGSTVTVHVTGASRIGAGEAVEVSESTGTTAVTERYLIGPNGAIEVGLSAGGTSHMAISGSTRYFIPNASQIGSCHPCQFTAAFTISGAVTLTERLAETVTSEGAQTVHVPAGVFNAEKLQMLLKISSTSAAKLTTTVSYPIYLVRGVGLVETGVGATHTSVMGYTTTAATGSEELLSFTR